MIIGHINSQSLIGVTRNSGAPRQNIQAGLFPFLPLSFPSHSILGASAWNFRARAWILLHIEHKIQ